MPTADISQHLISLLLLLSEPNLFQNGEFLFLVTFLSLPLPLLHYFLHTLGITPNSLRLLALSTCCLPICSLLIFQSCSQNAQGYWQSTQLIGSRIIISNLCWTSNSVCWSLSFSLNALVPRAFNSLWDLVHLVWIPGSYTLSPLFPQIELSPAWEDCGHLTLTSSVAFCLPWQEHPP